MTKFLKETDLCAAFLKRIPDTWTAYPETGGFDILLVRKEDGFQVGIEAKLKLNAKVICQAAERGGYFYTTSAGPDCRAVLVPEDASGEMAQVCRLLGITVLRQLHPDTAFNYRYNRSVCLPKIDDEYWSDDWHELAPEKRLYVPDYVPDVIAGDSAPLMLTYWKIAAIKIVVTLERRGYVTRQDFKHHKISMPRWTQGRWIIKTDGLRWVAGENVPDFKKQHPVNYEQIAADYDIWKLPELVTA